jgi:hypothetical protein
MGMTRGISLERFVVSGKGTYAKYVIKSLIPTMMAYAFATYIMVRANGGGNEDVLAGLVKFSASPPLYYIAHVVRFSIFAPFLYSIFKWLLEINSSAWRRVSVCLFFLMLWIIGYISVERFDILGQSYLFVYALGLFMALVGMPKLSWKLVVFDVLLGTLGIYSVICFYSARVAGYMEYAGFIDAIDSKLQMNPPNISVILYSAAVVLTVYILVTLAIRNGCEPIALKTLCFLGRHSLDIFLWHYFIRDMYLKKIGWAPQNVLLRGACLYTLMFGIPILGRISYEVVIKNKLESLREG